MNSDCAATPVFRETDRQRYGKLKYPLAWTIESESAYTYEEWVKELIGRMKDEVKQIMEKNWGVQFEVSLQMRYHLPDGTDKAKCVSGGRFRITSIEQLPEIESRIESNLSVRHWAHLRRGAGAELLRVENAHYRATDYFIPTATHRRLAERAVLHHLIRTGSPSITICEGFHMVRIRRDGKIVPKIWWCCDCKRLYRRHFHHLSLIHPSEFNWQKRVSSDFPPRNSEEVKIGEAIRKALYTSPVLYI